MSDTATTEIVLDAETIAEHLRWRLSNANAEIELFDPDAFLDIGFDTDREGSTIKLSVSSWNAETRQRGFQRFTLAVTPIE